MDPARVYAEALFGVAKEKGRLDEVREQLAQFADALEASRELRTFFLSPYFSSAEKAEGLRRAVSGAEVEFINFLELLIEKRRTAALFAIRERFEELWKRENRRLEVTVTSAVELDPAVVGRIGAAIERQTGQDVELASRVEPEIVGGVVLRVGSMVFDASIRDRLERLRRNLARAA